MHCTSRISCTDAEPAVSTNKRHSGATNVYDIEITTDNPGGGQAFETVEVTKVDKNVSSIMMTGLTVGTSYQLELEVELEAPSPATPAGPAPRAQHAAGLYAGLYAG